MPVWTEHCYNTLSTVTVCYRCVCVCVWVGGDYVLKGTSLCYMYLYYSFIPAHFTFHTQMNMSTCAYMCSHVHTQPPQTSPHTHTQHLQSAGPLNYKLRTGLLKLQQEAEIIAELLNIAAEPDVPVVVEQSESSSAGVYGPVH